MPGKHVIDRRTLFRSGLAAGAIGAAALALPAPAAASGRYRIALPQDVYDTGNWGARQPTGPIPMLDHAPTYIAVHHTVDPGNSDDFSLDRAFAISRSIQNFHMDSNGWIDTGQQFTISRGGYITEGRHRSLEALTGGRQHVQGANVANRNDEVIGIENEGLYMEVDVPEALWDSLVSMVSYIASQYGISPDMIRGHRDFNSTACPGDVLYARLPELREAVAARLGVPLRQPAPAVLLRPGDTGDQVRLAQTRLRAHGFEVRADGEFGAATREAVAAFTAGKGLSKPTCQGCAHVDERGYIGPDVWRALVPR